MVTLGAGKICYNLYPLVDSFYPYKLPFQPNKDHGVHYYERSTIDKKNEY